jgi:pimeloyl-ACP methyl ester carboxylesterase
MVLLTCPAAAAPGPAEPATPPITDAQGRPVRSAIASLEPAMIGGVQQWLLIRGHDIWNPVLLYLDSAPGVSQMAWSRRYNAGLEKHFVVVNWDQRGAGKSFTGKGHGYGALIGALAAQRHPELFHAFIAVAPVVNPSETDATAYRYAVDTATELGDAATLAQLKAFGPPPYSGKEFYVRYSAVRTAARHFAGAAYPENDFRRTLAAAIAEAPEYSGVERQRLPQAEAETLSAVYPVLSRIDLANDVPALTVPVYFLLGRHNYAACPAAAVKYLEGLQARSKALVWFEASAHAPNYEEPDRFLQVMVGQVLAATQHRREATQ